MSAHCTRPRQFASCWSPDTLWQLSGSVFFILRPPVVVIFFVAELSQGCVGISRRFGYVLVWINSATWILSLGVMGRLATARRCHVDEGCACRRRYMDDNLCEYASPERYMDDNLCEYASPEPSHSTSTFFFSFLRWGETESTWYVGQ
jgi:hypothetical protein